MKDEDPYYLGNDQYPPTILTVQVGEEVITQELPWDVAGDDTTEAFYVAMAHTFREKDVLSAMSVADDIQSTKVIQPHTLNEASLTIKTGKKTTRIDCGRYADINTFIRAYITAVMSIGFSRDGMFEDLREFAKMRLEELESIQPKENEEE